MTWGVALPAGELFPDAVDLVLVAQDGAIKDPQVRVLRLRDPLLVDEVHQVLVVLDLVPHEEDVERGVRIDDVDLLDEPSAGLIAQLLANEPLFVVATLAGRRTHRGTPTTPASR